MEPPRVTWLQTTSWEGLCLKGRAGHAGAPVLGGTKARSSSPHRGSGTPFKTASRPDAQVGLDRRPRARRDVGSQRRRPHARSRSTPGTRTVLNRGESNWLSRRSAALLLITETRTCETSAVDPRRALQMTRQLRLRLLDPLRTTGASGFPDAPSLAPDHGHAAPLSVERRLVICVPRPPDRWRDPR